MKCKSLKAIIDKNSRVLILGSMPGVKSLEMQQYYAHPQNRFWKVIGAICNNKDLYNCEYKEKIKTLLNNKIAVWDTIKYCTREGSLDSDILNIYPNDISDLLKKYPNIKTIYLNGSTSFTVFKKYFPDLFNHYSCNKMLSTSPANAKYNTEKLISNWKIITKDIRQQQFTCKND